MAKQRYINTKIWEDNWFSSLDQVEQLVFIYFLTNPMTNIIGAYELSKATITRSVGLDTLMLDELLKRFDEAGKVHYINGWVVLPNFIKHQNYKSPKIKKGIETELEEVPDEVKRYINIPYIYGIDTLSHLIKYNTNIIKESEVSDSQKTKTVKFTGKDMEMVNLMVSLIQKNNPAWKAKGNLDKWAEDINKINRIDERTYEQIEYMIKWTQKDPFWSQNILSASKLRDKFNDLIPKLKGMVKPKNYVL
jgi:hypothetical protein